MPAPLPPLPGASPAAAALPVQLTLLGRHRCVDIDAIVESRLHGGIAAEVGQHAKFDLGVVGTQQDHPGVTGYESPPDLTTLSGTNRDVLQVRLK